MTKDKHSKADKHKQPDDQSLAAIENLEQQLGEMTLDLQRTRADFENYRKRAEVERETAKSHGQATAILKLLPVIDNIERAITHLPDDLKEHKWAQSVQALTKQLDKSLDGLKLSRIKASPGTPFDPELHEAVMSEDGDGDETVISEELQAGYKLDQRVIRHSMVKVRN